MLGIRPIASQKPTPYATAADFCRIFREDMNRLYLLAYLLTGDQLLAEKCFVRGLEDAGKGNPVFTEWAHSWARRTVIQKAIEIIQPRPAEGVGSKVGDAGPAGRQPAEVAGIVELPAFERFAFVMSVLEHISDQECSLLLDCSRGEVSAARSRALQQMGKAASLRRKRAPIGAGDQDLRDDPGAALQLEVPPLAASV